MTEGLPLTIENKRSGRCTIENQWQGTCYITKCGMGDTCQKGLNIKLEINMLWWKVLPKQFLPFPQLGQVERGSAKGWLCKWRSSQTGQIARVYTPAPIYAWCCTASLHKQNRVANDCELCAAAFTWWISFVTRKEEKYIVQLLISWRNSASHEESAACLLTDDTKNKSNQKVYILWGH